MPSSMAWTSPMDLTIEGVMSREQTLNLEDDIKVTMGEREWNVRVVKIWVEDSIPRFRAESAGHYTGDRPQ